MPLKVLLVDDHSLFTEGLQFLLTTHNFEVLGIAKNGREGLQKARALKPQVVLLDIMMPGLSGLDTLKLLKAELPQIKVVMLTTSEEEEDLILALKFGASGYLLKSLNADELVDMLNNLGKGSAPLSPGLAGRLLQECRGIITEVEDNPQKSRLGELKGAGKKESLMARELTSRHLEVLELISRGKTYREAGEALGLSERTVKYHINRIMELLHLENRAQVIAYAAKIGLTDPE